MTREIQTMAWTAITSWMWAKRLISMTLSTALILWARRSQREERGLQIQLPRVRLAWTARILNHLMPEWPKSQNTPSLPPSVGMMTQAWKRSSKHTQILTLSRCWMLDLKHRLVSHQMLVEWGRRELHHNQAVRKWHERYSHQEIKGTLVPSRRHLGTEVALASHSVTQSLMFVQGAKQGSVSKVQQWSRRQNHYWWQKVNSKMDKDAKKRKKALQQKQPTDQ